MRSIFAPLAFEETASIIADSALMLASAVNGHVLGHHVRQRFIAYPPMDFFASGQDPSMTAIRAHHEATTAFARMIRAVFEERCDALGARIVPVSEAAESASLTASWTDETGDLATCFALAARAADIIIAAAPHPGDDGLEQDVLDRLLIRSGAPVFIVPRAGLLALPQWPVVIWDGSLRASRAIREARDVLHSASGVVLIAVEGGAPGRPSAEAVRMWLERTGLPVTLKMLAASEAASAEAILALSDAHGCDLIIVGSSSRDPLEDEVICALTQNVLAYPDRALFMVH